MLKISLWLKKKEDEQNKIVYIAISSPEKTTEGQLIGSYVCHVNLPLIEKSLPIYADNPIDAILNASQFLKIYFENLIDRGYMISWDEM